MSWQVYDGKRPVGFVETNYAWASRYWAERARITGRPYRLQEVKQ